MQLTVNSLIKEAKIFCEIENRKEHPKLYGLSDGKAIGTYIEHRFKEYLKESYLFNEGNSAKGIDFPDINTDIKVTSNKKPQSSCPFSSISQKVYGLGYNLLLFIYDKNEENDKCYLDFKSCQFIKSEQTGDYTLTKNLIQMVENNWTADEITDYLRESNLPGNDNTLYNLAEKIIKHPPEPGYLTISNAFQWRIKYTHINQITEKLHDVTYNAKKEYGDYQTPLEFANKVVNYVHDNYLINPDIIIEPTCGTGNFIKASKAYYPDASIIGIDINEIYLKKLENEVKDITLYNENIFTFDFKRIKKDTDKEYLLIGNTPWVTNTRLSKYDSDNLPKKENIKNLNFFESQTGMSNFDISENILLHLIDEFRNTNTTLVFLCKYKVACNIFEYLIKKESYPKHINIIKFNARKVFDIDTSACILVIQLGMDTNKIDTCQVTNIDDKQDTYNIGFIDNKFYSKIDNTPAIDGKCPFEWRQGIKHDCVNIMELEYKEDKLYNKQEQEIQIEDNLIYPLLKSSNLKKPLIKESDKKVIITQHKLKEDTQYIKKDYPLTWKYLNENKELFDNRKSSIYSKAPDFSIFGIGDYTFKPYKVAISGFYKKGLFTLVFDEQKTMMLDDTCYYLSFDDYDMAYITMLLLNTTIVQEFIKSIATLDSKRPYTKKVLKRIDISKALNEITINDLRKVEEKLGLKKYITKEKLERYEKEIIK